MAKRRPGETALQKTLRKVRGKSARYRRRRKLERTQALIISYPKSGRTWLRVMLTQYIAQRENLTHSSLDLYDATRQSPRFILTDFHHEQAHHRLEISHQDLVFDPAGLRKKAIIFLYRDPRDTAVSMYFQLTKRETLAQGEFFQGSLSDLLRDERFGLEKIIRFNNLWLDNGDRCQRFLPLCYEHMRENPAQQLVKVLEFLGDSTPDPALIDSVCEAARFDKMKESERAANYEHDSLGARIPGDDDSLKVRRGKVGGYRDYFSEDDHRYADELITRYAVPVKDHT
jgi:hypothetical protein